MYQIKRELCFSRIYLLWGGLFGCWHFQCREPYDSNKGFLNWEILAPNGVSRNSKFPFMWLILYYENFWHFQFSIQIFLYYVQHYWIYWKFFHKVLSHTKGWKSEKCKQICNVILTVHLQWNNNNLDWNLLVYYSCWFSIAKEAQSTNVYSFVFLSKINSHIHLNSNHHPYHNLSYFHILLLNFYVFLNDGVMSI